MSEDFLQAIEEYMTCYTTKRVQRKPNVMTPMEYHEMKRQHENCPAEITGRKRFLLF
ncbi:IS3 family transposase [Stomatobaculum longum]|uniref:IS3 family transposase n=1 Tax=Stomatobaculum longum TaxID=796942 RepID=UPI003C74BA5D